MSQLCLYVTVAGVFKLNVFFRTNKEIGDVMGRSQEYKYTACKAYLKASVDPRGGNGKKEVFAAQFLDNYQDLVKIIVDERADGQAYPSWSADVATRHFRKARA